ncbi:thiol reductant ABC exporter subunit CydC [Microvirga pudoricolor]|uniref:thiol reductant ABC exporter subunit CydC n=1 Tax=Microvirga pudoricolor TaxID=2778729 RepID=UPI001951720B|nr:thiol reductant ABC exporter subunit CydC [Microvirga pudoricolor]MBM6595209.1 thiol reductant ABC exporter subunit CydC [Microvirga pudoricolor]
MNSLSLILHLAGKRTGPFLAALGLSLVTLAAGIALLGVSGWFLTGAALTTAGLAFNLFGPSAMVRGLSLMRIVARYGEKLVGHDATLKLLADLRGWLFRRLVPRVPFQGRLFRRGDLVSRLTADVDALDTVFLTAIGPILTALAAGLAMTSLLAVLLPDAAPIYALGFGCASLALPIALALASQRPGEAATLASAELRMRVLDAIDGHADLRAMGQTESAFRAFSASGRRLTRARTRQSALNALGTAGVQAMGGVTLVGILWQGLEALDTGAVNGPVLVGLLLATLASFEAASLLARGAGRLGAALAAGRRVQALAASEPTILDPARPSALPEGSSVHFEAVRFGHTPDRLVLRDLSLQVRDGERVAIIGPSGCGKSTILHLLLRLSDPEAGAIRVAGQDIRTVTQANLHRRVALLSQDTPVFLGTIRDNLRIGCPDADDDALWGALRAARLDGFVRGLPEELDTWLGEAGRTLSAGQTRRLCLARVLLSGARIVALDEPTSGLDRETEADFLADLAAATRGRTVLLATHASLPDGAVDRVLRVENGRLSPQ